MKNRVGILVGLCFLLFITNNAVAEAATFPIVQNFSGSQPADWELRASSTWNTTVSGDQTLRLTQATTSQTGLGFYNESFPSDLGIVAELRYYAGGGTGADGFAFFLVDGDLVDETNIATGALGGALGYAQSTLGPVDGIPHAYLGVGFDEFGNFVTDSGGMDPGSVSPIADSVVLRGSGNGVTGYDYLTHRNVFADFGERIDGGWRIARITVLPATSTATIRVEMSWDEGETWETVINDYVYNEVPPANLKLGFTGGTGGSTNIHAIGNLTVNLPIDLETNLTVAPAGTYERGDAITYTYTVENHGPNDSMGTVITNTVATGTLGIANLTWNLTSTHGSSSSGTAANIDEVTVGIPAGQTVTVVVSGTVGAQILDTTDLEHTISASPEEGSIDPSPSDASVTVSITTDAPTASESALLTIIAYADSNGTSTAPTSDDYDDAGINDVTAQNLAVVNEAIAKSDVTTDTEVQAVVDAVTKIIEYGATGGASAVPSPLDYDRAGIDGVTTDNVSKVNAALADSGLTDPDEIWDFLIDYIESLANQSSGGATRGVVRTTTPVVVAEMTMSERIAALQAQVESLQKRLSGSTGGTSSPIVPADIPVRDLTTGMSGEDVKALQLLLIGQQYAITAGATGYFGSQTKASLAAYQSANSIAPAMGYFGIKTRTQMKTAGLAGLWW